MNCCGWTTRNSPLALLGALACWLALAAPLGGDEIDPVESGGDALREGGLPWYDADKEEIRSVEVTPPDEPPARPDVEQRLSQPKNVRFRNGFLGTLVQVITLSLLAALLIAGLAFLIRSLLVSQKRTLEEVSDESSRLTSHIDRLEQLPVPLRRHEGDLLGETKRQYELGNYNEAIVYLFSYLLVELDKSQRIRLVRGKTNRQYLREIRDVPPLCELVEQTMIAFEDVFFGDHELERQRFEACYNRVDEFHHHLEPVPA